MSVRRSRASQCGTQLFEEDPLQWNANVGPTFVIGCRTPTPVGWQCDQTGGCDPDRCEYENGERCCEGECAWQCNQEPDCDPDTCLTADGARCCDGECAQRCEDDLNR